VETGNDVDAEVTGAGVTGAEQPPAGDDDPRLIRVADDEEQWETLLEVGEQVLNSGRLVVLPTDTVYGVGCNPFDPSAVDRIYQAKARGRQLPLPVLVHTWRQAIGLVEEIDDRAKALIAEFWPGPLTIIFREAPGIGWDLGESKGTVGVRMPKHPFTQALIRRAGPLAVTSANLSGRPTPSTAEGVMAQLDEHVGVYFDGGEADGGPASTIVDLTGPEARVLRTGAISAEEVERVLASAAADGGGGDADR
jgi:tRNA threonylcarbamoyl adenosine modification protein (Sua5/YciO/YrdC/YwlC family)